MNYWSRQDPSQPLFPELSWSKPENKRHAGKLLIIGGNLHGFSAPASAYNAAEQAGIGSARVLLPDAIRKTVGTFMPEADFGPTTPSGSFASQSLDVFLEHAGWADGVLVAGDLGRNSETAILLEKFAGKYSGPLTITKDGLDYFSEASQLVLDRPDTLIVASFAQLQRLATAAKLVTPLTFNMDLVRLVEALHSMTELHPAHIIVKHHDVILVASAGRVSTTKVTSDDQVWRVATASAATVWWVQHLSKPFEAITHALADHSST